MSDTHERSKGEQIAPPYYSTLGDGHNGTCYIQSVELEADGYVGAIEGEANAAYIVRACNSHEGLVAIAERTVTFLDLFYELSDSAFGGWAELRADAREIVLSLKGEQSVAEAAERFNKALAFAKGA